MPEEIERLYTINFTRMYKVGPKNQRAARLVKYIREFVGHHMKAETEKVWIDETVNEAMWGRGILKPPRNIRVKVTKFDDGVVEVTLPEVEKKEGKKAKAVAEEKAKEDAKAKAKEEAKAKRDAEKKAKEDAEKAAAAAAAKPAEVAPAAAPAPEAKPAEPKPAEAKKE